MANFDNFWAGVWNMAEVSYRGKERELVRQRFIEALSNNWDLEWNPTKDAEGLRAYTEVNKHTYTYVLYPNRVVIHGSQLKDSICLVLTDMQYRNLVQNARNSALSRIKQEMLDESCLLQNLAQELLDDMPYDDMPF